jgi:hypothetical protein
MSETIRWMTLQVSRRRFLRNAAAASFGTFAGLAVGVPKGFGRSLSACCTGPYGSGYCGSSYCNGHACHSYVSGVTCDTFTGVWASGCWTSYSCSGTCCDCECGDYEGDHWYCYCHDGGA